MSDIRKAMSQDKTIREIYQELDKMTLSELRHLWPLWKKEMDRCGIRENARALMAGLVRYCMIQKGAEQCSLLQM